MADTKGSALTALTGANSAAVDQLLIIDKSDTTQGAGGTLKNITRGELAVGLSTAVIVADAVGTAPEDTAAINAAFTTAGTGGVISFPPNQTYRTQGLPGSATIQPRLIHGNGSVIKLRDEVASTIAAGSGPYSAGATAIVLTSASDFAAGDKIVIASGTTRTNPVTINSIATNTLTLAGGGLVFETGTSVTAADPVSTSDSCLHIEISSEGDVEITGLVFDGNKANRATNRAYHHSKLLSVNGDGGPAYFPAFWVHHNVFRNAPCDSFGTNDLAYLKVTDNHFKDGFGSGFHPGGSAQSKDVICSQNTFSNVFQASSATTPTLLEYGHVSGHGAMVTSLGPIRYVVSNNVVDTCTGYGFDGINNSGNTHVVLANNIFTGCSHGGFRAETAAGSKASITGNVLKDCGQAGTADTGGAEYTKLSGTTNADITVTGNVFDNSVLGIVLDSAQVVVSANMFNLVTKVASTEEQAALMLLQSGSEVKDSVVTGNVFRGPRTEAEIDALSSDAPLNGIQIGTASGITISANAIVGFRHAIQCIGAGISGLSISNNSLKDQLRKTGENAHGIIVSSASSATAFNITGNTISRENETIGAWIGLEMGTITTARGVLISGNTMTVEAKPAAGRLGMVFGSNTGAGMVISNNIVNLFQAGDDAISANSFTAACKVLNNDWQNSPDVFIGAASTSIFNTHAITSAEAIDLNAEYVSLSVAAGTYAVTLAAPSAGQSGQTKVVEMIDATGTSVTLALTNVIGGSAATTATFNAVDDTLTLIAAAGKWMVTGEGGVTLS
jgi:hypothetical protein